jgi:hypothetical protein
VNDRDVFDVLHRELPALDVDDLRSRRIRGLALVELARAGRANEGRLSARAARAWRRTELWWVGALAVGYLVWAAEATLRLYR